MPKSKTGLTSSDPLRQAAASIERLRRAQSITPADYLGEALAELSSAVEAAGFELGEVTLRFDEDEREVRVQAGLRIPAELLDISAAADGAIGAPRGELTQHYSTGEEGPDDE